MAIVDEDGSTVSRAIVSGAQADPNLRVLLPEAGAARDAVRTSAIGVAAAPGVQ